MVIIFIVRVTRMRMIHLCAYYYAGTNAVNRLLPYRPGTLRCGMNSRGRGREGGEVAVVTVQIINILENAKNTTAENVVSVMS